MSYLWRYLLVIATLMVLTQRTESRRFRQFRIQKENIGTVDDTPVAEPATADSDEITELRRARHTKAIRDILNQDDDVSSEVDIDKVAELMRTRHMKASRANHQEDDASSEVDIDKIPESRATRLSSPKKEVVQPPSDVEAHESSDDTGEVQESICTCGVFMSGQFNRSTKAKPRGDAVLSFEGETTYKPCGVSGYKQCINRCLDTIVKHLSKSETVICNASSRDIYKEKAYLYVKNCDTKWFPTNFSAGKHYCCRDGESYRCTQPED